MNNSLWQVVEGNSPLVATAIHDGHEVRSEVAQRLALSYAERLREEDPHTGRWTGAADTRVVARRSRFEVDLNRPRAKAVYLEPEDAWGLHVWRQRPPAEVIARSLGQYDAFYERVRSIFENLSLRFGRFVVFDIHSYNQRRGGPKTQPADPDLNPEVNIGTGTLDRQRWAPIIDRFISDLRAFNFLGRGLDVRENVKFRGGQFSNWIHENFPASGCSLAIEFKKFFMDEWTGDADEAQLNAISSALESTVPGVLEELERMNSRP